MIHSCSIPLRSSLACHPEDVTADGGDQCEGLLSSSHFSPGLAHFPPAPDVRAEVDLLVTLWLWFLNTFLSRRPVVHVCPSLVLCECGQITSPGFRLITRAGVDHSMSLLTHLQDSLPPSHPPCRPPGQPSRNTALGVSCSRLHSHHWILIADGVRS